MCSARPLLPLADSVRSCGSRVPVENSFPSPGEGAGGLPEADGGRAGAGPGQDPRQVSREDPAHREDQHVREVIRDAQVRSGQFLGKPGEVGGRGERLFYVSCLLGSV